MPKIIPIGVKTEVQSFEGSKSYAQNLTKAFDGYKSEEDVTLHCSGNSQVKTNKISLLFSSKLFQKIFETNCDCNTNMLQEYNVVCPDFDPRCMAKVLELINSGTTAFSPGDDELRTGMISIIQSLQINIHLQPETSNNIPQKIADKSDKLKNLLQKMDEEKKITSLSSQNMDGKIEMTSQKMTEIGDEIGMSEFSDVIDIATQNMFNTIYTPSILEISDRLTEIPKSSTDSEIKGIITRITKLPMPYICKYCDLRFPLSIGLKQHLKKQLSKSKLYKSASVVEQQQKEQHQEQQQPEQMENDQQYVIDLGNDEKSPLLCPFCDQLFKNVVSYDVHVKNHSDDNSSKRGQAEIILACGKASDNEIDKLDKMEMNWSETSSQDLGTLQKSQKGGTNGAFRFKCPVCSSARVTNQDLRAHLVMNHYQEKLNQHSNKTQRKCKMCEQQFINYYQLVRHLVSGKHKVLNEIVPKEMMESLKHIKADIYKTKRENMKKSIKRRRKLVLNEIVPKVVKHISLNCPVCSSVRVTNQDLDMHLVMKHYKEKLNQHSNKTERKCKICEQQFSNYFQLVRHLVSGKHNVLNEIVPKEIVESLKQIKADIFKKKLENKKCIRRRRKLVLDEIVPREMVESLEQIKANNHKKKLENMKKNARRRSESVLNETVPNKQVESLQQNKADFCMKELENVNNNTWRRSKSVLNEIVPKEKVESPKQIKADFCEEKLENEKKNIRRSSESVSNKIVHKEKMESLKQINIGFYTKELEYEMKNIRRRRKSVLNTETCLNRGEEDVKVSSMIESPNIISTIENKQRNYFKCPICKSKKKGFHHLKVHIGSAHYKDEVKKLENKDTRGCNLCPKTFKVLYHLRSHVVHNHQFSSKVFPYELLKKLEDMKGNAGKLHSI